MLALAHHLQVAIDKGIVADRAQVARSLGFTRAPDFVQRPVVWLD